MKHRVVVRVRCPQQGPPVVALERTLQAQNEVNVAEQVHLLADKGHSPAHFSAPPVVVPKEAEGRSLPVDLGLPFRYVPAARYRRRRLRGRVRPEVEDEVRPRPLEIDSFRDAGPVVQERPVRDVLLEAHRVLCRAPLREVRRVQVWYHDEVDRGLRVRGKVVDQRLPPILLEPPPAVLFWREEVGEPSAHLLPRVVPEHVLRHRVGERVLP